MKYLLSPQLGVKLFAFVFSLLSVPLVHGQIQTFGVTFEADSLSQLPATSPGSGDTPTALFGNFANTLSVQNVSGNPGSSGATGKVLTAQVPVTGNYQSIEFAGALNSGIVAEDSVKVSFDFLAHALANHDGFAFMRCYDESGESFADLGFSFDGNSYNIGLLDYDPASGNYLGWLSPPFPTNNFETGRWYHLEALIDLNQNTLQLWVDGTDYGVVAGISRATGSGYAGAYLDWGTAYQGICSIDNFEVEVLQQAVLPEPPAGFQALLTPEDHGGTIIRIPCGDFRERGLDWEHGGSASLLYDSLYQGVSGYRLRIDSSMNEADARLWSFKPFPIQANRTYEVSALIRTDFPRATWEMNIGLHGAETDGTIGLGGRYAGMPAITTGPDGWERWTWRFTPHWDDRYESVRVFLGAHEYGPGFDQTVSLEIADLAFVELPPTPLVPFPPGEGVSFPGGAGNLPMQIESVLAGSDTLTVQVTGATYQFLPASNTILLRQRIDYDRQLAELTQLPLANLTVHSQSNSEVILVGDKLTIGVQMDGVLVISPHEGVSPILKSSIGGDFNRMKGGDVLCQDDFGGFTLNLYTPKGTGVSPQLSMLTSGVDFPLLEGDDLTSTGDANPGWEVQVNAQAGERIFLSAFPCRPYDWEKSFEYQWGLSDYDQSLDYTIPPYTSDWVLWNINQRGWAMSFGERYEVRDNVPYQQHMDSILAAGDQWSAYFSQWFYYSRDAEEWTNEIMRWRNTFGMGAIYSDGLAQDDWLSAYEAMRRLRGEVFPDGNIIIHDSYPQSGVPAASFRPFIYTYATSTYMGDSMPK
ncbi:MAG: hypothetical protein AAF399_25790 [Bacteroidota bacterium]